MDAFDFASLDHWHGDGMNHILVNQEISMVLPEHVFQSRAIVAQPTVDLHHFRPGFDMTMPWVGDNDALDPWQQTPNLLPVRRHNLVSFMGNKKKLTSAESIMIDYLSKIRDDDTVDEAYLNTDCTIDENFDYVVDEFAMCADTESRMKALISSTFSVIPCPSSGNIISTVALQIRLLEAIRAGTVPVLIGCTHPSMTLPFSEVIDWRLTAIILPWARMPELHFILSSFADADLFAMQRQGQLLWKTYFSSRDAVLQMVKNVIRERLFMPAPPVENTKAESVFDQPGVGERTLAESLSEKTLEKIPIGPLEEPRSSFAFRRNFSSLLVDANERWNKHFDPFTMAPSKPWDPILSTDAKYFGSSGFRPIGNGAGGIGKTFRHGLGGNQQTEQFTVVMTTFERETALLNSIEHLYRLPFLHSVVIVWNSPEPPRSSLRWPDIGVPVHVVKTDRNSLNNRFLPFDFIQTDAVFSLDDDIRLHHEEIVFAFRVWRENRDR